MCCLLMIFDFSDVGLRWVFIIGCGIDEVIITKYVVNSHLRHLELGAVFYIKLETVKL